MRKPDLPYIEEVKSAGKTYYYFRRGGKRQRLPDNPDSEEFSTEYWGIRNGNRRKTVKTTWGSLIESYYNSPKFKAKAKGTQANYRRHCEEIRKKNGTKDMTKFRRKHAIAARDTLADTWSKANERVAILSILCKHAVDLEWIKHNPVVDIEKLTGGEYEPWPAHKLRAYEAVATGPALTAYHLALGTGQRIGDCVKMKWADYDGEYIRVVQEKTGADLWIYCPDGLRDHLETLPRNGAYILARDLRRPMGKRAVQTAIEVVRNEIGVMTGPDRLVPHGWRYTAAVQLAEAGNTDSDIQKVTGHKTLEMVQKYRRQADQRAGSKRAQQKRSQKFGD